METRCAIRSPRQRWRCNQSPPSIAWIIPSLRRSNSRYGAGGAVASASGSLRDGEALTLQLKHSHFQHGRYLHRIDPASTAGASVEAPPTNIAQLIGDDSSCVVLADQPTALASPKETTTPDDGR